MWIILNKVSIKLAKLRKTYNSQKIFNIDQFYIVFTQHTISVIEIINSRIFIFWVENLHFFKDLHRVKFFQVFLALSSHAYNVI